MGEAENMALVFVVVVVFYDFIYLFRRESTSRGSLILGFLFFFLIY